MSIKVMPNDYEVYSGNNASTLKYLNLNSSEENCEMLPPHNESVSCLTTANQSFLVSGSKDQSLKFWDIDGAKQCTLTKSNAHSDIISCLASNSKYVFSASRDSSVKVWEISSSCNDSHETRELDPEKMLEPS